MVAAKHRPADVPTKLYLLQNFYAQRIKKENLCNHCSLKIDLLLSSHNFQSKLRIVLCFLTLNSIPIQLTHRSSYMPDKHTQGKVILYHAAEVVTNGFKKD